MDVINLVVEDWRPSRVESRAQIRDAIAVVAELDGEVHISTVRPLLPATCDPHQVGAVICSLVRQHVLEPTGVYRPNGLHSSRNRTKPAQVYRLVAPLPAA